MSEKFYILFWLKFNCRITFMQGTLHKFILVIQVSINKDKS